jgi:hypothetical protein
VTLGGAIVLGIDAMAAAACCCAKAGNLKIKSLRLNRFFTIEPLFLPSAPAAEPPLAGSSACPVQVLSGTACAIDAPRGSGRAVPAFRAP